MNDKTTKIILAILLVFIIIALTCVLIFALNYKKQGFFHVNKKTELIKEEIYSLNEINKINVESKDIDIRFITSNNNEIKVQVYGEKDDEVTIDLKNGQMNINYDRSFFCIGFCSNANARIEVTVPANYENDIDVKSVSGDIDVPSNNAVNVNAETTSGDIQLGSFKNIKAHSISGEIKVDSAQNLEVKTTSGDIEIHSIENKLEAITTSGDIDINTILLKENSTIKTVSGDVEINRANDIYIDTKTTSGDVDVFNNNRQANTVLEISTTSGDIEVN